MYQLISFLIFPSFAQGILPFNIVSPINEIIYGERALLEWEILENGYEFKPEILMYPKCESIRISFEYTSNSSQEVVLQSGSYCWRLKYRVAGTEEFSMSDIYTFSYVQGDPYEEEEDYSEEEDVPAEVEEDNENDTEQETESEVEEPVVEKEIEETKNEVEDIKENSDSTEVLGEKIKEEIAEETKAEEEEKVDAVEETPSAKTCSIIYDKRKDSYYIENCSFEFPNITESAKYGIDDEYDYVLIKGSLEEYVEVNVKIVDCKAFNLFDPSTWFKCTKETTEKTSKIKLLYSPSINIEGKRSTISSYDFDKNNFVLKIFSEKLGNEKIDLTFNIYFYILVEDEWIDVRRKVSTELAYSEKNISSGDDSKPFEYVFNEIIGVTQWHGYTIYSSPHTGIDFGSIEHDVLSPMDGTIVSVGWDNYYGECNSGGNFVKIKHTNGMYTVYFHLENYINEEGREWVEGDTINEGQRIGISGNTGAYNCQKLGYHLHYELRKSSSQDSHVDPVIYTNIDWDLIPTINWKIYPGRLTGDNPHPNF